MRPIGRLPTSPRKMRATGRLNGAKPIKPPHSASATSTPCIGNAPSHPMTTSPMLTGTNSATVIQSMPSMKLVRLTNHKQASSSSARSTHHGSTGTTRSSEGRPASTIPTANACRTSRGATPMLRTSSQAPTAAMNAAAAKTRPSEPGSNDGSGPIARAPAATAIVAAMTAMPPPCGVDLRCDERALG